MPSPRECDRSRGPGCRWSCRVASLRSCPRPGAVKRRRERAASLEADVAHPDDEGAHVVPAGDLAEPLVKVDLGLGPQLADDDQGVVLLLQPEPLHLDTVEAGDG